MDARGEEGSGVKGKRGAETKGREGGGEGQTQRWAAFCCSCSAGAGRVASSSMAGAGSAWLGCGGSHSRAEENAFARRTPWRVARGALGGSSAAQVAARVDELERRGLSIVSMTL